MKCVPEVFRDKGTLVAACHKAAVAMFGGGNR